MKSKVAEAIGLKYEPVALILSDTKPEGAMQFKEGKWGCVMWLFASAAKGRAAVADENTFGCIGGGVGLGFGNQYNNWPGGIECFYYFLSTGNKNWEKGRDFCEKARSFLRDESYDNFVNGEAYVKTPEMVKEFVEILPIIQMPTKYVIFKPLKDIDPEVEKPVAVIFLPNPDQLAALVVFANYARPGNENVYIPQCAGCQSLGIYPIKEANSANPRAVIGLVDLSARLNVRKQLGAEVMTFAVPFGMFEEMENNVEGSFLERHTWKALRE